VDFFLGESAMENMNQENSLSLPEYDQLCREACEGFVPSGSRDADEELLLRRICKKVFAHLGQDFLMSPVVDASNLMAYKLNLQRLVGKQQTEWFDTLETPGKYIQRTLSNSYEQL
jgi:hypothetical protein